jgi:hypothetical protein
VSLVEEESGLRRKLGKIASAYGDGGLRLEMRSGVVEVSRPYRRERDGREIMRLGRNTSLATITRGATAPNQLLREDLQVKVSGTEQNRGLQVAQCFRREHFPDG